MSELPLEPALAKCLLTSDAFGCSHEMVTIAALLSVKSVWMSRRGQMRALDTAKNQFAVLSRQGSLDCEHCVILRWQRAI